MLGTRLSAILRVYAYDKPNFFNVSTQLILKGLNTPLNIGDEFGREEPQTCHVDFFPLFALLRTTIITLLIYFEILCSRI